MTTFSLDRMNNMDPARVAQAAIDFLDRLQEHSPEVQTMGAAVVFMAFCRKYRQDPAEIFRAVTNILATRHRDNPHVRTLDLYVEHEL